jgi:hypothetical protein
MWEYVLSDNVGASGLLGRAVVEKFRAAGDEGISPLTSRQPSESMLTIPVLALAWTRADKDKSYTKLDLMDESSTEEFFAQKKVDGE